MPVKRALRAYQEEKLNCTQSVLRAFQLHRTIHEDDILRARHLGGGRAEAGLCGSLYAALLLADEPPARQKVREAFVATAGSDKCREIRRTARIPCVECVQLAVHLLVEQAQHPSPVSSPTDELS